MGLVWVWYGSGMGLVWDWYGTGSGTHFFSTFGDDGGVTSSPDDELDDESLSSDFWFFTFGLFGFNGFDFLAIGDRDLDRLDFLRGEGVRDPYLRYVSGLILRDLKLKLWSRDHRRVTKVTIKSDKPFSFALWISCQFNFDSFSSTHFLSL